MLVRVYTCLNATLLEITCHSSNFVHSNSKLREIVIFLNIFLKSLLKNTVSQKKLFVSIRK